MRVWVFGILMSLATIGAHACTPAVNPVTSGTIDKISTQSNGDYVVTATIENRSGFDLCIVQNTIEKPTELSVSARYLGFYSRGEPIEDLSDIGIKRIPNNRRLSVQFNLSDNIGEISKAKIKSAEELTTCDTLGEVTAEDIDFKPHQEFDANLSVLMAGYNCADMNFSTSNDNQMSYGFKNYEELERVFEGSPTNLIQYVRINEPLKVIFEPEFKIVDD